MGSDGVGWHVEARRAAEPMGLPGSLEVPCRPSEFLPATQGQKGHVPRARAQNYLASEALGAPRGICLPLNHTARCPGNQGGHKN